MLLKLLLPLALFLSHCNLFAAEYDSETEEMLGSVVDATDVQKQMCRNVRSINSGEKLKGDVCEPYWPKTTAILITANRDSVATSESGDTSTGDGLEGNINRDSGAEPASTVEIGVPSWADQVRERPDSTDKRSKKYEGDYSPAEMAERGDTMASRTELQAMEAAFARTRDSVAGTCCGSNRECANHFRRVRLQFCTNPRATTHPNEPDRCTGRDSGIYTTANDDELYMKWWLLRISRLPQSSQDATRESVLRSRPQLRNRLGQVAPGIVSISRYERADSGETIWTFRHELGHACSSIRRQLATRDGSPLRAGDDYNPDPKVYCRYTSDAFQQFSFMGEFMRPENARDAGTCISNGIRNEVRNKNDQSYIPNACYGAKIEEGIAETFALMSASPENIFFNLKRSCTFPPSRLHFTGHKIVKCLADNSAKFRSVVLSAPVCRADQPEAETGATEAGVSKGVFMNNTLLSSPAPTPAPTPAPAPAPFPAQEPSSGGQQ